MFWRVVSLSIFTSVLYFKEPVWRVKIQTIHFVLVFCIICILYWVQISMENKIKYCSIAFIDWWNTNFLFADTKLRTTSVYGIINSNTKNSGCWTFFPSADYQRAYYYFWQIMCCYLNAFQYSLSAWHYMCNVKKHLVLTLLSYEELTFYFYIFFFYLGSWVRQKSLKLRRNLALPPPYTTESQNAPAVARMAQSRGSRDTNTTAAGETAHAQNANW